MNTRKRHLAWPALCLLACACIGLTGQAFARLIEVTPENYRAQLAALKPGDTLHLTAGEYRRGLPLHRISGTREAPIVIRGPAAGDPAVLVARPGANTISIVDAAHIQVRDLHVDGRGIAVDAVKLEGTARWAHHITLQNLTIVNHGANQQIVGISTKAPAWGWIIRGNRIHGAGTGMYLGNSDGSAQFFDGLIEHNLITDPLGYAIQIKHQRERPVLENAPRGRHITVLRHNVLSKAHGGSAGAGARPNLLLGHWPRSGEGSNDEYHVYGNFLHENPHEALLQAEGNVAFYNNVLLNRHGPGIHIQPHNDVPREIRILHNTVITSGPPIIVRVNEATPVGRQFASGNAVFSPHAIQGGVQVGNAQHSLEDAAAMLVSATGAEAFDPHPRGDALRCAPVNQTLLKDLTDGGCDFNGRPRANLRYCGAYAGPAGNGSWLPALEMKPKTACQAK